MHDDEHNQLKLVPGNRESPRGDKLILSSTIFTVDILNTTTDGGSWTEVQHRLTISKGLKCALHLLPK